MKKEAHTKADEEPQELIKSMAKIKTRESSSGEREDVFLGGNPPSTRSVKTDPVTKSFFAKSGIHISRILSFLY